MIKGRYFNHNELKCKCGCETNKMQPDFVEKLDKLREKFGKPIRLSSAYRCPTHNNNVSGTGFDGPHTTGRAVDILVGYGDARRLLDLITEENFPGLGVNQKGRARFIHIDDSKTHPRPSVWSY